MNNNSIICDIDVFTSEIEGVICESKNEELQVVTEVFNNLNKKLNNIKFVVNENQISCEMKSIKEFIDMTVNKTLYNKVSDTASAQEFHFLSLFVRNCYPYKDCVFDISRIEQRTNKFIVRYYLNGEMFSNIAHDKQQLIISKIGYLLARFTLASIEDNPIGVFEILNDIAELYPITFDLSPDIEEFANMSHNIYLASIVSESLLSWYKSLKFR